MLHYPQSVDIQQIEEKIYLYTIPLSLIVSKFLFTVSYTNNFITSIAFTQQGVDIRISLYQVKNNFTHLFTN